MMFICVTVSLLLMIVAKQISYLEADDYSHALNKDLQSFILNNTEIDLLGDYQYSSDIINDLNQHVPPIINLASRLLGFKQTYQADEISLKSPEEIIRLRGFETQTHYVHTRDGYHIQIVRIINPKLRKANKRSILFNHGLIESATMWLINSKDVKPSNFIQGTNNQRPIVEELDYETSVKSLPFLLANTGYDVWLLSMRGTEYSLGHDKFNYRKDKEFWRFSLDHFEQYDIPDSIDYIMNLSNSSYIGYVGHSQATYSIFALLSNIAKYNDLIKPVIAIAPVAYLKHITSPGSHLMKDFVYHSIRDGPFPRNATYWRQVLGLFCFGTFQNKYPCFFLKRFVSGWGQNWLKGYYSHIPYWTSWMVLRHFSQIIRDKRFARYDYGPELNEKYYNSSVNPGHPMEKVTNKWMCFVSGKTDSLSTPGDVKDIEDQLKVKLFRNIVVKGIDHFDLMTGHDIGKKVNQPVLDIFEELERNKSIN